MNKSVYDKYELLLPSKFDGGFLIISLYEKIQREEIESYFTAKEINESLKSIAEEYGEGSIRQWSKIKGQLLHYYIRNYPDETWKYYLTDYAKNIVGLMLNKLDNPYRDHPLRDSFEKAFSIRYGEIKNIVDLERRFGRIFIQGPKNVITDHLEALEDELKAAYMQLNEILRNEDVLDATSMIKNFTVIFSRFGDRATDITNTILSKDKFLRDLQQVVDTFYQLAMDKAITDSLEKERQINELEKARGIYWDISTFFDAVDRKAALIRRQITNASSKLTELQEQFSARAQFRITLKKFFQLTLDNAKLITDEVVFENGFPIKSYPFEETRILYPRYQEYGEKEENSIVVQENDEEYDRIEREKIQKEIKRQEIIQQWSEKIKNQIIKGEKIEIAEIMAVVNSHESDISIAYQVVANILSHASANEKIALNIQRKLTAIPDQDITLWKTSISKS